MELGLNDKVVLITGAGGAIGSAMAKKFASFGAKVVVSDINEESAGAVAEEISGNGFEASAVTADVSDMENARAMIERTVSLYGRLDILINNAGINGGPKFRKPIHEFDDGLWSRIINIDLNGVFYCSKPAVKQMIAQGSGGNIINIASIVGVIPLRFQCAFAAAKAAVINLSKAMAIELASENIRVNVIAPGSIMTEGTTKLFYANSARAEALNSHIPQRHPGTPEDIAHMACFLASDKAAGYITGALEIVDGGWTVGFSRDF